MGRTAFTLMLIMLGVAGCGGSDSSAPATVTVTQPPSSTYAVPAPTTSAPPPVITQSQVPAQPQSFVMPNYIGQTLQAAQDGLQALTGNPAFFSTSSDATGQGRMQVLDRGWQVCNSNPAPGESFTDSTPVDFGVVRAGTESCP